MGTLERVCEILNIGTSGLEQVVGRAEILAKLSPEVAFAILLTNHVEWLDPALELSAKDAPPATLEEDPPEDSRVVTNQDLDADVQAALAGAGVVTLEDVRKHPDLTQIKGIGPATRNKLLAIAEN